MLDKSNLAKLKVFDNYISKLSQYIVEEGGTVVPGVYPTIAEAYDAAKSGKNILLERYYNGIHDIDTLFNLINNDQNVDYKQYAAPDHPEAEQFLRNMKAAYSRMLARNDMALTVKWGINYDPVSKLIVLLDILFTADNESWDSHNETLLWLEHNLGYAKKISFYSQYYPDVLVEALKGYERTEILQYTDDELKVIAHAVVRYQKLLTPLKGKLKRMSIDNTSMEAHEKNNKAAESFIGYGNQKREEVAQRVIDDAKYLNDNVDLSNSCCIYTNQHRIQPDGNKLVDAANIHINEESGKVVYDRNMLFAAVERLTAERGYIEYYSIDDVVSLPEIRNLVTIEPLPLSFAEREKIVESHPGSDYILNVDKETGEFLYKWKVKIPYVFNSVADKYPNVTSEKDSVGVKTRGVFAAMSSASRLGQTFLYPFMDAVRLQVLPDDHNYSFMAQWSHPDHLRQMFTDMAFCANPDIYKDVNLTTRVNQEQVRKLHDELTKQGYYFMQSSDDKSGFDNMNSPIFQFAFSSCILAYCFDLSEDDKRVLKWLMGGAMFPVVITPSGVFLYSLIIASGMWCTSLLGTMSSNFMSLVIRYILAGALDFNKTNPYKIDEEGEEEDTFEQVTSEKEDNDDDEEIISNKEE
jgi:hypothetical protein